MLFLSFEQELESCFKCCTAVPWLALSLFLYSFKSLTTNSLHLCFGPQGWSGKLKLLQERNGGPEKTLGPWRVSQGIARIHHVCISRLVVSFATPWSVVCQAPLSMEIFRQEKSGLPVPSPADLLDPGMDPAFPALHTDSLSAEAPGKPSMLGECKRAGCSCGKGSFLLIGSSETRLPIGSGGKESACQTGDPGSIPGLGRIPWRREWLPTPAFLPGEFHGQRSLAGYSPWGFKESDDWGLIFTSVSLYKSRRIRKASRSYVAVKDAGPRQLVAALPVNKLREAEESAERPKNQQRGRRAAEQEAPEDGA